MSRLALLNGTVRTVDARDTVAHAVGVADGRIVAVGEDPEVLVALPGAERIDLAGRTVLPGFVDAHIHFLATGEMLGSIDVRFPAVRSLEELVDAIRQAARVTPPGRWIHAVGFDDRKYARAPTRWDFDRATTEHPVMILHRTGHHALANSAALAARGVSDATPDPKGGRLVRDERGRVTGMCLDAASGLVQPVMVDVRGHGPNFHLDTPLEELVASVERADRAVLEAGLTTVCDAQVTRRELTGYREARRLGTLRARTVCMPLSHQLEDYAELGLVGPFGDDRLWIGPLKVYADGSLIGGTAAFSDGSGQLYHEPDELRAIVVRAHELGWRVGVHAQGDRAIGHVLDAFAAALEARPDPDPRFRIEHAGCPSLEQVRRMAELGVVAVTQPSYLHDSGDELLADHGERAHRFIPLREELEAGVRVVVSSDSDVASYRPLDTIAAAVRRRTMAGAPIGPLQALTTREAIRAHTIEGAAVIGAEDRLGSIEPGKLADLVVLDADPLEVGADDLASIPVWMTVLDGRVVHAEAG